MKKEKEKKYLYITKADNSGVVRPGQRYKVTLHWLIHYHISIYGSHSRIRILKLSYLHVYIQTAVSYNN